MADPNDTDDDRVGYKNAPKATRFTKGKSGNPGGRPKKQALDMDDRVIALVEAKVPHSELTMLDLMYKSAIRAGVQGDMRAIRFMCESYGLAKRRRRSTATEDEADRAIVEALLGAGHPVLQNIVDEASKDEAHTEPPDDMSKCDE